MLNGVELRPGMILNMSSSTRFGRMVRWALARGYRKLTGDKHARRNCPSHSAMVVEDAGALWIGEAQAPRAGLTSLTAFQDALDRGVYYNFRIFEPIGATTQEARAASAAWMRYVCGRPYDAIAMLRLLLKAAFGDIINSAAGVPWAFYCTEANMTAWRKGAGRDFYHNKSPTPLTEFKRFLEGYLIEIAAK